MKRSRAFRRPYPAKALTPHNNPKRIAIRNDGPRVTFYAARSQIAAEICARRGVDPRDPTQHKRPVTTIQAKAKAKGQAERRSAIATMFSATPQGA